MTATEKRPTRPAHPGFAVLPREHGATAMLLIPFISAAILLRRANWLEFVALMAIGCALAVKDPLVVLARQRWIWRDEHPETSPAKRAVTIELALLAICGGALMWFGEWRGFALLSFIAVIFTLLAVFVNVRNRQRAKWFQLLSAAVLSSTCLAACLSAGSDIPRWCWALWLLSTLQATSGIFVVHARLDARIGARKASINTGGTRKTALICQLILALAGVVAVSSGWLWIAVSLFAAASCYLVELRRQKDESSLQMPLKRVGQQALTLSVAYALLIITGLWRAIPA
jgi:hypothetical protein